MAKDFNQLLAKIRTLTMGVTDDSRKIKKGMVFVAISGLRSDGHRFISKARQTGVRFIVGEKGKVDYKVKNSREALSQLAAAWYGNPAQKMKVIGVTGTDGKTTTSTLIYWILKTAGKKVGLISTVSAKIDNKDYDTGFHVTNPEPIELQKFLGLMAKKGCKYVVLEVTSHGLDQHRVYGIDFDIGVLTNITHEHLNYHKTMANYVKAKAKLFNSSKVAILNKNYLTVGEYIKTDVKRIYYDNKTLCKNLQEVVLNKFLEPYNVLNATAAYLAIKRLKIKDEDFVRGIHTFPGVEGRMQEISNKRGIRVIIDFAHTPNALRNVLMALRGQVSADRRLIVVFGCAGERDIQKRPMMAEVS
ncbi:MAG: UDP-N-acetylmuramoyl-L-alanyl-D-glutamate--2,6-diaminopimelate ligase, partial [Patescibacteria group bacterium]